MIIEIKDDIKLLSTEVQEIISNKPNWILRNGITLFFLIITCLVSLTFFISYPDIVNGKAKLTSINAPKEVKTKTEGKLIKLFATEGKQVKQNEIFPLRLHRAHFPVVCSKACAVPAILPHNTFQTLFRFQEWR